MKRAESGATVKVHYTGRLDDGTVFDSSRDREPLEFTLGKGWLIKGFEDAVLEMSAGETKTVRVPSDEAYGSHREELMLRVDRTHFPPSIEPREGLILNLRQPDGGIMEVAITEVSEDSVTLDANHPLAGKDLIFEIEMMEVSEGNPMDSW
jgi:peptidylprolyl isomerase